MLQFNIEHFWAILTSILCVISETYQQCKMHNFTVSSKLYLDLLIELSRDHSSTRPPAWCETRKTPLTSTWAHTPHNQAPPTPTNTHTHTFGLGVEWQRAWHLCPQLSCIPQVKVHGGQGGGWHKWGSLSSWLQVGGRVQSSWHLGVSTNFSRPQGTVTFVTSQWHATSTVRTQG